MKIASRAALATALMLSALGGAGCRTAPAPAAPATPVAAAAPPPPAPAKPPPAPADDDGMGMPAGKRVGPADVPPVTVGGVTYRVVHWGKERGLDQNGGYVEAVSAAGKSLWIVKVFAVKYDGKMEEDVQDVFIATLAAVPGGAELAVSDERGGEYRLDTRTHAVRVVRPRAP